MAPPGSISHASRPLQHGEGPTGRCAPAQAHGGRTDAPCHPIFEVSTLHQGAPRHSWVPWLRAEALSAGAARRGPTRPRTRIGNAPSPHQFGKHKYFQRGKTLRIRLFLWLFFSSKRQSVLKKADTSYTSFHTLNPSFPPPALTEGAQAAPLVLAQSSPAPPGDPRSLEQRFPVRTQEWGELPDLGIPTTTPSPVHALVGGTSRSCPLQGDLGGSGNYPKAPRAIKIILTDSGEKQRCVYLICAYS